MHTAPRESRPGSGGVAHAMLDGTEVQVSRAAAAARGEFDRWVEVAALAGSVSGDVTPPRPTEFEVTGFDPRADLERRARGWGVEFPATSLADLARFAAGLARAEAEAWAGDDGIAATRAYEDRRFLFGDRIVGWAVPWTDVAGRCHPDLRQPCHRLRDLLLEFGEQFRMAPALTGSEGLTPPGEDSFGPFPPVLPEELTRLGSGTVIFDATAVSLGAVDRHHLAVVPVEDLRALFENAAARWESLAAALPGSARLWLDLAARAGFTAAALAPES